MSIHPQQRRGMLVRISTLRTRLQSAPIQPESRPRLLACLDRIEKRMLALDRAVNTDVYRTLMRIDHALTLLERHDVHDTLYLISSFLEMSEAAE